MKIAAYCRVSTDKDEQLDSLAHQKEFFIAYAQKYGHELVRLYADEGITGTSLKRREEFGRLMRDARTGAFQALVVKDISRLARNTVDFLVSIRQLKAMGINTVFLTANMDTMGDSEFVLTLFSAMAQEESGNLSKRVKFGKRLNAEKGRVPLRIFGYDRIDNFTLAILPEEARIVRKIFSLYCDQGLGCRSISQTLNRDGDQTKYGGQWDPRGVRRILRNPIYCGHLINHKYEIEDYLTGKQIPLPKEEHFHHTRPQWAIVSADVYENAQQIMAQRRIQYDSGEPFPQGRYSGKHLFSTLIKCKHCGRSFTRKTYTYTNTRVYWHCVTNDQYTAQRCDNSVSLDEPELIRQLRQYILASIPDMDAFEADVIARVKHTLPEKKDLRKARTLLESKRKKLMAKQARYREMYANDLITLVQLKQKLTQIDSEVSATDAKVAEMKQTPEQTGAESFVQQCNVQIHRFLAMETWTNGDMRRILDHICVDRDGNIRVVLKKLEDITTSPIGGSSGGAGSHDPELQGQGSV